MLLTILNYFFLNIISISIISISVCGTGLILNKFFNIGFKLEKLFFYGVLVKIILIFFLNFFFSLNFVVNIFLISIGFYFFYRKINEIKKNNTFSFITLIPFVSLISIRDGFFFDNFLYHIPLINLLIENNLVLGQSNINFRFGTPTLIYGLYSSFYLPITEYNSSFLLNSVFFIFVIKYFLDQNLKKKTTSTYILIILILFILIDALIHPLPLGLFVGRLGVPEYDLLVGLLHIYTVFYVIENILNDKIKNNFYILILLLLIIFIKPTIFPIFFIFLWLIFLQRNHIAGMLKEFPKQYLLLISFVVIFLSKSFLSTGCFYPYLKFTCQNVSWYSSNIINTLGLASISWKGYTTNVSSLLDFSWVIYWFKNYFLSTSFFIYFLTLLTVNFLFILKIQKFNINKSFEIQTWKKILILHFVGIIFWFLLSPDLRFVWSTIFIICSIIIFNILKKLNMINRLFDLFNLSKKFNLLIILLLSILSIKNLYLINYVGLAEKFKSNDIYVEYINKKGVKINIVKKNNFSNYKLCGFTPNPCSIDKESLKNLNFNKNFIFNEYNFQ
ncbi:hypothetical protein [Candidatus Pelagibacter sp.]|uniref:hypothetical protein n=1 Tax=Candidatus Pelagibacter sp. TaxID=2024849 RepID=UPI003F833284